jgi:hypothetical protein
MSNSERLCIPDRLSSDKRFMGYDPDGTRDRVSRIGNNLSTAARRGLVDGSWQLVCSSRYRRRLMGPRLDPAGVGAPP